MRGIKIYSWTERYNTLILKYSDMKKLLILFICFLSVQSLVAQDKDKLERERQELQNELMEIQSQGESGPVIGSSAKDRLTK